MGEPSQAVRDLVAERQAARQERDFARADALREQLRAAGWLVRDTPAGPELAEVPPYEAVDPAALRPRWDEPDRHEVTVVVHGEQEFVSQRPIRAGDRLLAVAKVASAEPKGRHELLTIETQVTTEAGDPVCTVRGTLLSRGTAAARGGAA